MTRALTRSDFASAGDAALVALVLAGHCEAYEPLVNRHQRLLYRHARGMGLDHDTSLDLVQDAFVRAYTLLAECREPGHFRAWVFRITRNLCLDHLKSVRRLTIPLSHVTDAEDIPHSAGGSGDAECALREALLRLPVALREAFLLKHDAGYTYEEVAEMTGASPSAVKMRVHRAREALRAFLIDQGITAA